MATNEQDPFLKANTRKSPIALKGLFIIACFYTLYFARPVFLPIVIAFLLNFLLAPLVRILKKIYIPEPLSAVMLILIFLGAIGYGFYSLSGATKNWLSNGPQNIAVISSKIDTLIMPVKKELSSFFNIREQIEKTAHINPKSQVITVTNSDLSHFNTLFTSTGEFFTQLALIFFILYFLLAAGDFFLKKTVEILPTLQKKKEAIIIARQISSQITNFLLTKSYTGLALAVILTIVLHFEKMPRPLFWGILAAVFEFIPYIGVAIVTFFCAFTSLLVFNSPLTILLPPVSLFVITSIMGNFIVPLVLSKSLTLHPVIVFVSVIFGGWMWGVPGALIAIPLVSILKIFCNNIQSLSALGKFLGE